MHPSGIAIAVLLVFLALPFLAWAEKRWGHVDIWRRYR
jgi:hypothetical protein